MGNALEFAIKLLDQFTPVMRQVTNLSNTATAQIERQMNSANSSSRRMTASVNELRTRLDAINQVRFSTTIQREFDTATRAAQRLESQISSLEGRGSRSGGGMLSGLGGLIPGIGIVGGIGKAVTASADAEMSRRSFGTLLGNQGKGNELYNQINKFGTETVLDNAGLAKNAQTLLAFGTAGDKIMPTLKMLGDVSMGDQQRMESLTLAFAQTNSAGKLMGQDLLQYINAGFNPLNEIAKMTGASMADLKAKMEKGAISADMVNKAFQHATAAGGQFHNALNNASTTVAGKWGNFMGTVQTKLVALGDLISPITKAVLDFANALLSGEPAALILSVGLGALFIAIGGVTAATKVWNFVIKENPIMFLIGGLILLGTWIYSIMKQYDGWGKSTKGLWEIIKGFGALAVNAFKNMGEGISYWIEYAWLKTKNFFQWIGAAVGNVAKALSLAVKFDFDGAKQALSANITTSASKDIALLEAQHNAHEINSQQAATAALQQMAAGRAMIGLNKIGGSASGTNPVAANGGAAGAGGSAFAGLGDIKDKADKINSGGQRSIVINIGKQIEKMEVHVMSAKEGANEIESAVREALRKVLLSVNGVAVS